MLMDIQWIRYSLFFVLYPVGIGAEWWLMLSAARVSSATAAAVYYFCLLLYVPGESRVLTDSCIIHY